MKHLNKILVTLAFLGLSMSNVWAQATYIITKSGENFAVTVSGGGTLGTPNAVLQNKINDIKADADGAACTIQFGNGEAVDLGSGSSTLITFNGVWGEITLT